MNETTTLPESDLESDIGRCDIKQEPEDGDGTGEENPQMSGSESGMSHMLSDQLNKHT